MAKACELFQELIHEDPTDGFLHARFAEVLRTQPAEAKAEALEAVRLAPDDCRCWLALGCVHYRHIFVTWYGSVKRLPQETCKTGQSLTEHMTLHRPGPERIAKAQQCLRDALQCIDKAVALAPEEFELHQCRFCYQRESLELENLFADALQKKLPDFRTRFQNTDLVHDMREMARLRPEDPQVLSSWASLLWYEAALLGDRGGDGCDPGHVDDIQDYAWRFFTPSVKEEMKNVVKKLQALTQSEVSVIAKLARQKLGLCLYFMMERDRAEKQLARALRADPTCEESWDLLLACKHEKDTEEAKRQAYKICVKKLAALPTPRNHLLLAWECANQDRLEEAVTVLRAALHKEPDNIACRLGLAAALLQGDDAEDTLAEARECLNRVKAPIHRDPSRYGLAVWLLLDSICLAFEGKTYQSPSQLESIARFPPLRDQVQKALSAFKQN